MGNFAAYKEPLASRMERQARREENIRAAFQYGNTKLEVIKREKKQKKKTVSQLMQHLSMKGYALWGKQLRDADSYVPRSHNIDKQLTGLINHLYVKYPVPYFLYQAMQDNPSDPFNCMRSEYQLWFITLAQGGSFNKLVKGIMTAKEASCFLEAPNDARIHENVWWVKLMVAGVPRQVAKTLVTRVFSRHFFDDPDGRLVETIKFFANHHASMSQTDFEEIVDFVAWKLVNDRAFRLKGRTASSVLKLSNEWHLLIQKAKLGTHVEWAGLGFSAWQHVGKSTVMEVTELLDNRELMNEGRKQKHCVYSYVNTCYSDRNAIFSLRVYHKVFTGTYDEQTLEPIYDKSCELSRVTLEVSKSARTVVQVRGHSNRMPSDEEKKFIRMWAGDKGVTISPYYQ